MTKTRRREAEADWRQASEYWMSAFRQVSDPMEYSVPGTLFEIVAGMITWTFVSIAQTCVRHVYSVTMVKLMAGSNHTLLLEHSKRLAVF
jgi:hypothetical protein